MAGGYNHLARAENVAGFAVVYGIFLSLGELGPGNNIGLLASKTSATGIRGMYYGIAAAMGKIGAFVGVCTFQSYHSEISHCRSPKVVHQGEGGDKIKKS